MSRNPMVVTLPAFTGLTRLLIVVAVCGYLGGALLTALSHEGGAWVVDHLMLHPDEAIGIFPTELVTYPFAVTGLIGVLFSCLSLWFFGSALEGERGRRWFGEYFFTATIAGGAVACLLSRTVFSHVADLSAPIKTSGLWPAVLALIVAFGYLHPDQEVTFNFLFRVKAKYLAVISVLVYLALALTSGGRFDALVTLCVGLSGYAYLRWAPRQGLRFLASERWYAMRNASYKRKRQKAAKKFTVYMKKQGRDVHFDPNGRFESQEDLERRDPNDKTWMN